MIADATLARINEVVQLHHHQGQREAARDVFAQICDRPASGHSIIGLAVFHRSKLRAEAVGRCWSQGRLLAWLADS